jgi:hypothetical protein
MDRRVDQASEILGGGSRPEGADSHASGLRFWPSNFKLNVPDLTYTAGKTVAMYFGQPVAANSDLREFLHDEAIPPDSDLDGGADSERRQYYPHSHCAQARLLVKLRLRHWQQPDESACPRTVDRAALRLSARRRRLGSAIAGKGPQRPEVPVTVPTRIMATSQRLGRRKSHAELQSRCHCAFKVHAGCASLRGRGDPGRMSALSNLSLRAEAATGSERLGSRSELPPRLP